MKKIDFHIHTIPVATGERFVFSLDKMKEYVTNAKLDAISITNHNLFDKVNYDLINNSLSIPVFPGIELDIEKSHILVISPIEDIDTFEAECSLASNYIKLNMELNYEKFIEIFKNKNRYLIIPHYRKKPTISSQLLSKFKEDIFVGEVSSAKKWFSCIKSNDNLIPVLFSDVRIKEDMKKYPSTLTYVSCEDITIPTLKIALSDKTKVKISLSGIENEFQILSDGTTASTGLNIILGLRSSGKTYTLESILASFKNEYVKYIEQFSIVSKAKDSEFKKRIETDYDEIIEKNLFLLKPLVQKIMDIDDANDFKIIETYLDTLKDYAEKSENKDEYSKSPLFLASEFSLPNSNELESIIQAVQVLLDSEQYKGIINDKIGIENLKKLLLIMIDTINKQKKDIYVLRITNNLINSIKDKLDEQSALSTISSIDFNEIARNMYEIKKFNEFIIELRKEKILDSEDSYRFKIKTTRTKYVKTDRIKKHMKGCPSITTAFSKYDEPFQYIKELVNCGVPQSYLYKMLVDIQFDVTDIDGNEISGGEQAEYILYSELKDASKYDMVLIDEPESSFDNIFLKDKIIEKIKNLAQKTTVFLVTHNSTLGILMNPNKIIYTQKNGKSDYQVYTGTLSSKEFRSSNNTTIKGYKALIDIMEAGEDSYKRKSEIYESIKD